MRRGVVVALAWALSGVAAAQTRVPVDLLLHGGQVLTVDKAFSIKSAIAVKDGKVVATGGPEMLSRYEAKQTVDLKGRTLLPGFNDVHQHIFPQSPRNIDMTGVVSIATLQEAVRKKAAELGPGEWINGPSSYAWDEAKLAEKRNPTRKDLDEAAPNNPVVLVRAGGHSSVGNSLALKIAGIDRNTPDPKGGLIEHFPDGEPNGIVRERSDLFNKHVPPDKWTPQLRANAIAELKKDLAMGITSINQATTSIDDEPVGKGGVPDPGPGLTYRRFRDIYDEMGADLPRAALYIDYPGPERLKAFPMRSGDGDAQVRIGPIGENPVDGGFTGPTAWLLADYKDQPGFRGKGRYTDAELQAIADDVARNGWQLGLHTIGDAAIVQAVRAYSSALRRIQGPGRKGKDRRWFLDHFSILPPVETMKTMKADGVMIAQQPNFLYGLEQRYIDNLDAVRLAHNNPIRTPYDEGLFIAFSSDGQPKGPIVGLYAAIFRKGPSGRVHGLEEAVSRELAIRMYTANGAYLTWEEDIKGTLEPGKLADMVVLDRDPLKTPAEDFLAIKVDMTFVGGKLVYQR